MIQLSSLTKSFGDRILLDAVNWQIDDRERVGLSGPNGAGKTTLLKMLAGIDEPDSGLVVKPSGLTIGYLPQDGLLHTGRTLREEAGLAFKTLLDMRAEIGSLEERLGDDAVPESEHAAMLTRYSELQDEFRRREGYSIDLKITTVLRGLGFSADDMDKPSETFSGGWQMRIALAKLLLGRPGLLLLDEPTNHLDLDARNWLEEYLSSYPHAVILVSHDRFFLDAVVTRITEIGLRKLTDYTGNYSDYLREREARMERLRQQKRDQDEEVARMEAFINRFRYQATKAAQVQSRIKMLDKVVPDRDPARAQARALHVSRVREERTHCARSARRIEVVRRDSACSTASTCYRARRSHRAHRPERRRQIHADADALGRRVAGRGHADRRAPGRDAGTSRRTRRRGSIRTLTVYQTLAGDAPIHMVPSIRNILGGFLFSGDDVDKPVRVLSGGERTRLAVARMLLRPSNTLLLDEPTNHLDLDSKDVLLEALEDFGGTLIFVSHDRYFVDKLATKVIEIGGGQASIYPGNYEEFLWSRQQRAAAAAAAVAPPRNPRKPDRRQQRLSRRTSPKPDGAAPAARRRSETPLRRSRIKPRPSSPTRTAPGRSRGSPASRKRRTRCRRVDELEARIAEREQAIKEIEATMSAPGFYDNRNTAQPIIDQAPGADVGGR